MSANNTTRFYNTTLVGNMTAPAVVRYTQPKDGKQARPIVEFKLAVNASRDGLAPVYHRCGLFVSEARKEAILAKLQDTKVRLEVSGDQKLGSFKNKDTGETVVTSDIEVGNVFLVTLEKGQAPKKENLFSFGDAAE